ncbi:15918_t:CDS:2 [Rhizophagus irregularis]|nr:15918_t:CDS:2 [Rhizophagus irregularis]
MKRKRLNGILDRRKNGNLIAQKNLGFCYSNGIGTDKNEAKAFESIAGCAEGQCNLGCCYGNG